MVYLNLILNISISAALTIITTIILAISYNLFRNLCTCPKRNLSKVTPRRVPSNVSIGHIPNNPSNTIRSNSRSPTPKSAQHITGFFRCTSIICCTLFSIVCLTVTADRILLCVYAMQKYRNLAYIIWIAYFLGRMVLTLIFLGRLLHTFKGSALQYSKCTIYSLKFIWCLTPISGAMSIVLFGVGELLIYGIIFGLLFVFIDILLSCTLLYLYVKKLFDLCYDKEERRHSRKLITLMTRYALLYTFTFVSTMSVFIFLALSPLFLHLSIGYQQFIWIIVSIDSVLNVMCLWLNYSFAKRWYKRLCSCCHTKCKHCCIKCTGKSEKKEVITDAETIEIQTLKEEDSSREQSVDCS